MNVALILAGGVGTRAGGLLPKQFQNIGSRPVLWWSLRAFRIAMPESPAVVVISPDNLLLWTDLMRAFPSSERYSFISAPPGSSRFYSVKNGLNEIGRLYSKENVEKVFIHDGARPLISPELIQRGDQALLSEGTGAIPLIPVSDSLRKLGPEGQLTGVDRSSYRAVQTPQVFFYRDISDAYNRFSEDPGLTDDASIAERAGISILSYPGEVENIKITNPSDFEIAEALLNLNSIS